MGSDRTITVLVGRVVFVEASPAVPPCTLLPSLWSWGELQVLNP